MHINVVLKLHNLLNINDLQLPIAYFINAYLFKRNPVFCLVALHFRFFPKPNHSRRRRAVSK